MIGMNRGIQSYSELWGLDWPPRPSIVSRNLQKIAGGDVEYGSLWRRPADVFIAVSPVVEDSFAVRTVDFVNHLLLRRVPHAHSPSGHH